MMRALISLPLIFAIVGCSSIMNKTEEYWEKPGASDRDFNVDRGQCNAQAFSVAGGNLMQMVIVQNSCLQGKGWQLVARQVPRF